MLGGCVVDIVRKEVHAVANNPCQSGENKILHGPSNRISLKLTFIVCFLSLFAYRIVAFVDYLFRACLPTCAFLVVGKSCPLYQASGREGTR